MNEDAFNDIPAFVAAVEAGGFSAGARRLNLSRSTVGKAISRLESRLEVRLFNRTTRAQSLTENGQAFYEHCMRALAELRAGKSQLESGRKDVRGRLRVSMPVLFGRLCVAPVLTRLAAAHPGIELELDFNDRLVNLVDEGFDLTIRNGALSGGSGLMARRIATEEMTVCSAPSYLATHGKLQTLADIHQHEAVTYGRNGRDQRWIFPSQDGSVHEIAPRTRLRFGDIEAIADAAARGFGLAWLPDWLVRDKLRKGDLVPVLQDVPALVTGIHVVWPVNAHLPTRVRSAIDALVAEVPALISI